MKRLAAVALILLAALTGAPTARAVPRTMLLETFTNTSCLPCATNDPAVHQFLTSYGSALALGIDYHVNWPSASDPFYLLAPEANTRAGYYHMAGLPVNDADGGATAISNGDSLTARANVRLLTDSPFALTVQHAVAAGQVNVTVTVNAAGTVPAGTLMLRVALVETEVDYATAPGSNGEKVFYSPMRRLLPDANGTALTINHGEQKVFNLSTPVVTGWNTANLRAIAWVQNDGTQEVVQAGSSIPKPADAFYFGTSEQPDIVPLGTLRGFVAQLIDAGGSSDTYAIHIAKNMPAAWSGSVCVGSTCYPPWTTDITATLGAGGVDTVLVDVTPLTTSGTGTMTLTATSQGDTTKHWTRTFKVISSGVPILCVDADGGNHFEGWYTTALDSIVAGPYATWDRAANGALSAAQLENFAVVIWNADLAYPPLTAADMTALGAFLDHGGRLFVSGQDIGWSLCDTGSPTATTATRAWYAQYLGADYVADASGLLTCSGTNGDPIGAGLAFAIDGGTGAGGQDNADVISPRAGAFPVFVYTAGSDAAIRFASGAYKVVYLAYGFAAQATWASRKTVLARSLSWLDFTNVLAVPGEGGAAAPVASAPRALPNPFTRTTRIAFVVGGRTPVPLAVAIFDVAGRRLRTLWDAPVAPGARSLVWDGRNEHGARVANGVYLARVRIGDERRTLKLSLTE